MSDHALLFATQREEVRGAPMEVEGELPEWLRGALVRTGPGVFESPGKVADHWFEGLAMMSRIELGDGAPVFSARLLRSRSYEQAQRRPRLPAPLRGIWQRLRPFLPIANPRSDNAGVNVVAPYGAGETVAMTETVNRIRLDPRTLEGEPYAYSDDLIAHLTTAHPVRDDARGAWFNYGTQFGKDATYHLWALDDGARRRRRIAKLTSRRPAYMHSLGSTEHHLLLTEFPLFINAIKLRFGHRTLFDYLRWDASAPLRIRAVHKDSGAVDGEWRVDPDFAFHHVAAHETNDGFEMLMAAYDTADIMFDLKLDRLRSARPPDGMSVLRRYDLRRDGTWERRDLAEVGLELPRVDPRRALSGARYVYGTSDSGAGRFTDQLVRIDARSGDARIWRDDPLLPGEPVFVPRPDGATETDGAVLALALDPAKRKTALLVLDADTFQERARAWAPIWLPQGFHGDFHRSA